VSATRPNILLIVADCARSDKWLGRNRRTITPTLDRLAAEGVSIPTTIAETACTTPCFAGLLSGAYSFRHGVAGVGGYRIVDDLPLLPEILKQHGYYTVFEATGPLLPLAGLTRGFDEYNYRVALDYLHGDWGRKLLARLRNSALQSPWFTVLHLWELHLPRQIERPFRSTRFGGTPYERAVSSLDASLAELLAAAGPNTLTIFTGDHGEKTADEQFQPGTAVPRAAELYGADCTPPLGRFGPHKLIGPMATQQLRARYQPRLEQFCQRTERRQIAHGLWTRLADTWRILRLAPSLRLADWRALHADKSRSEMLERTGALSEVACRSRLDKLVAALGDDRLFEMYLRMWAGMLRLHLLAGHVVHVYDYLVKVPLVLHWPARLPRGFNVTRMVRQVDIAATLLDLLDVPASRDFSLDGRSFAPLIHGREWSPQPAYLSVTGQPRDLTLRGVRTEQFKFTYGCADAQVPRELYDLAVDPGESTNLAAQNPDRCAELQKLADSFIPQGGPRIRRLDDLSPRDQRMIETRLRELGYVE
jgi:arylsulfatase A-like enzyme